MFYPGGSIYLGKISVNGEYIAPNDLDCAVDSFPGVWDIARKMKIIFPRDKDDAVIDSKCRQLFSGEKTLDELGGSLSIWNDAFQMAIYYLRKKFSRESLAIDPNHTFSWG